MLGKLIKYEMKAYGRILVPIYIALLALAGILGATLKFAPEWMTQNVMFGFAMVLYIALLVAVVVVTTIIAISRYYNNMLGREGYLTFSLPVTSRTLMISKTLAAMIWSAFGAIVGIAAVLMTSIVSINGEDYGYVKEAFRQFFKVLKPYTGSVIFWAFVMIMALVVLIIRVYAAVSIGSQWSGHRLIGSVLVYVGFKVIESIIAGVINSVRPLREGLNNFLFGVGWEMNGSEGLGNWRLQIFLLVLVLIELVVYWLLTWYFTDKKLNLE